MKRFAVCTLGLIVALSLASAQDLSKSAKIERILAATNAQATMNQMFEQMKGMMASQMPAGTSPAQQAKALELQGRILDLVKERMTWDKMRPQYVRIYDETFSDAEIDGILAFYQSPAGRAMLEKMPLLMPKVMSMAQAQVGDLMPEILRLSKEAAEKQ